MSSITQLSSAHWASVLPKVTPLRSLSGCSLTVADDRARCDLLVPAKFSSLQLRELLGSGLNLN